MSIHLPPLDVTELGGFDHGAMTVHWTIDHDSRRLDVATAGDVTRAECDAFLDTMVEENVMPYRKLFDATAGETSMGLYDLLAVCARIRKYHGRPTGPLAIVMPGHRSYPFLRVLGALAAAKRPMRIFRDLRSAQRWINGMAPAIDGECSPPDPESKEPAPGPSESGAVIPSLAKQADGE
ncbi:MAG: hypothetical protein U1E60_30885 [Reyranellaceae bacterium]